MDYIQDLVTSHPDQADISGELGRCFSQKLWFQLTVKLLEVSRSSFFQTEGRLVALHDKFVKQVAGNLDRLSYAQFAVEVARQKKHSERVEFLESLCVTGEKGKKLKQKEEEANLVLKFAACISHLEASDHEKARVLLEDGRRVIDRCTGIMNSLVYSRFHKTWMHYHKLKGPATDYFSNALLFLTYTPLSSISSAEQVELASSVGLAALVGRNVYNFGELLQHDVLKALEETKHAWIQDMLFAFNRGDIMEFKKIFSAKKSSQPQLVENEAFLNEKIRLMTLMEQLFKRSADERILTLQSVADSCQMEFGDVEQMLMRSFSLGLCKGSIDQVDGTVRVTWVQPRVLDKAQLKVLSEKLGDWSKKTKDTAAMLAENAPELISSVSLD